MSGLVSFGGDPVVVASIDEIERSRSTLGAVQQRLLQEFELADFLVDPLARAALATHTPLLLARLEKLKWAAGAASSAYLSTEARITKQLDWVTSAIAQHPWLLNLLPRAVSARLPEGLAATALATVFVDGKLSRVVTRESLNMLPALTTGQASSGRDSVAAAQLLVKAGSVLNIDGKSKVRVDSVATLLPRPAPKSVGDLASRIAETNSSKRPSVVVEKYTDGKKNLYVAYLPGMRSLGVVGGHEPFDLAASVQQLADPEQASSQLAVEKALAAAGVTKSDELILAGYSQGGMVAASLATNQTDYQVSTIVTLGSPIAQLELPKHVSVMAVEHTNDVIPALSGSINPLTENWLTVGREIDLGLGESALTAHEIEHYLETANLIDQDDSVGVARIREATLKKFEGLRLVETQTFELKEVSD